MENETLRSYRVFLVDVDGVLVRGGEVVPGAVDGLAKLQRMGRVLLLTNNSTRSRDQVAHHMRKSGFSLGAEEIVSSAFIAGAYLREHYGSVRVWTLGEEGLDLELALAGHERVSPREAEWIVAGMDRALNYDKLAEALCALSSGCRLLATNEDRTFPTPDGPRPGAGATVGALTGMGYPPTIVVGKPSKIAFETALKTAGCERAEVLMIGDRPETDILGAREAGIDSAIVLTGVTQSKEMITASMAPQFVADSILDLAEGRFTEAG